MAPPVIAQLRASGLADDVGVVEIDPQLSDTARTQESYDVPPAALANCVVVAGRRAGIEQVWLPASS